MKVNPEQYADMQTNPDGGVAAHALPHRHQNFSFDRQMS